MTRILVIESDVRARYTLRLILEGAGYDVDTAATADEVGQVHPDSPIDLIIADSVEAHSRLSVCGARILAVPGGCTGRERAVAERVRTIGVQNLLPKPFRRDDLLAAVKVTLNMAPPGPDSHPQ